MPRTSTAHPPPVPRRSPRSRNSIPSSSAAASPSDARVTDTDRPHNSAAAFIRALQGRTFNIPHAITRLGQQFKYVENLTDPTLRDHIPALRKIFLGMLSLQVKLPSSHRFHILLETEHPSEESAEFNHIDLFSLFSSTVSTETSDCRSSVSILGELLVDFKFMCDSEGSSAVHNTGTQSAVNVPRQISDPSPPSTDNSIQGEVQPIEQQATRPESSQAQAANAHDSDEDEPQHTAKNYVPPEPILAKMKLPHWFPAQKKDDNEHSNGNVLKVDIDGFYKLTYDQVVFVYSSLIRGGHSVSLLEHNKAKYENHEHFKSVFSFIPFTPPLVRRQY